jgi:hypothetical protein
MSGRREQNAASGQMRGIRWYRRIARFTISGAVNRSTSFEPPDAGLTWSGFVYGVRTGLDEE